MWPFRKKPVLLPEESKHEPEPIPSLSYGVVLAGDKTVSVMEIPTHPDDRLQGGALNNATSLHIRLLDSRPFGLRDDIRLHGIQRRY